MSESVITGIQCPACGLEHSVNGVAMGAKVRCSCDQVFYVAEENISQLDGKPVGKSSAPPAPPAEPEAPKQETKPKAKTKAAPEKKKLATPAPKEKPKQEKTPPVAEAKPTPPPKQSKPAPAPVPAPEPERKPVPAAAAPTQVVPQSIAKNPVEAVQALAKAREQILGELGKVIIGQQDVIDQVLVALFAKGHCLLKGVPGLAKTLLVNTLSKALALDFHRIQFTPDLMPTDITGTQILAEDASGHRYFNFQPGPIFTNILLADEINRTPPKTQASLLEAMQEMQVTSGGKNYPLPKPFIVLATQNPIEQEGTYMLPEAQLDRFIFMVNIDYPNEDEELRILMETTRESPEQPRPVLSGEAILEYQDLVRSVPVTEHVASYANRLVRSTRPASDDAPDFIKQWLHFGCGPRAGQSLLLAAKANAVMKGRYDVSCEDIRAFALPTLRHRIVLNFAAASEGLDADAVIDELIKAVPEDSEDHGGRAKDRGKKKKKKEAA